MVYIWFYYLTDKCTFTCFIYKPVQSVLAVKAVDIYWLTDPSSQN